MKMIFKTMAAVLVALSVQAQSRETIAIDAVKPTEALKGDMAKRLLSTPLNRVVEALDRHLITSVTSSRKFTVVGRQDLKAILSEQDLGQSGIVAVDSAAEQGAIKGAKYKLVTVVDSFQEESARARFDDGEKLKRRFQVSAQATVYDTSTGEVLDASNIQVEKVEVLSVEASEQSSDQGGRTDEMMPLIARELADKTTARLVAVLFPAKVIDVDGTTVTINRGEGFFKVGDVAQAFSPGRTVVDPDTGETLKIKGKPAGSIRITSVDPTTSQGEIDAEGNVKVGSQVSMSASEK